MGNFNFNILTFEFKWLHAGTGGRGGEGGGRKEEQEHEEENLLFPMMHKLSPPPFRLTSYLCILRF